MSRQTDIRLSTTTVRTLLCDLVVFLLSLLLKAFKCLWSVIFW